MREYMMNVIGTAFLCGLTSVICPSGKLKKTVAVIASLVLVITAVAPILSALSAENKGARDISSMLNISAFCDNTDYKNVLDQSVEKMAAEAVCEYVGQLLESELEALPGEYSITSEAVYCGGEIIIESISVTLLGKGILINPRRVMACIKEKLDCNCTVYEEWGDKNGS